MGTASSGDVPNRIVVNDLNGYSKWIIDHCLGKAYQQDVNEIYDIKTDSFCQNNIYKTPGDSISSKAIPYYKAFVQRYNSSLINNKMRIDGDGIK